MEKSRHGAFVYAQKVLKHSLFLFLLINLLSISPDISASTTLLEQKYTLNLSFKDARLEQVLDAIMKQSGVKIAYSSDELQKDRVVSVDIQTSDILTALRSVLGDGYSFKQIEDYIAIARKEISDASDIVSNIADDRNWTIQGQVLENTEPPYPLPGVNILIKGTSLGTVSDGNGYFSIKAKKGDVLIFRYLGFKDYEYVVSRSISNLTVSLTADSEELDEIVVTGISEEKRVNSVSAVSTLDVTKNLSTKPITSLSQSLQGGITGLNVTQSSGLPGADAATIKIRGISSLITNNDPLVLVDGIPMDMNQLDPNTIESVTVLKDAAASAIYGARAANGVIVVKTRRGMPGKIKISYNGYYDYLPDEGTTGTATNYKDQIEYSELRVSLFNVPFAGNAASSADYATAFTTPFGGTGNTGPGTYPYGANKDMLARKQLKGTTYTFYSDGFFDRRPIKEASNGNYGVSLGNSNVAYQGVLYFNPDSGTNASVFFPSAGRLNNTSGALESRGSTGYYWSASVGPPYMRSELQNPPYDRRIRYGAWSLESAYNSHNFRLSYQGFAQSIRCVKE